MIIKLISENLKVFTNELRIAWTVTSRIVARYITELENRGTIERKGL